jgi:hypothetical protein
MADLASQGRRPPAGIPDLADDYRTQLETWRRQALALARLRSEVLAAAESEAAGLVKTTRTEIGRSVADARRKLLELAAQVQAIAETPDVGAAIADTQAHILEARHDVRRALEEARPDIERLSEQTRMLRPDAHASPASRVRDSLTLSGRSIPRIPPPQRGSRLGELATPRADTPSLLGYRAETPPGRRAPEDPPPNLGFETRVAQTVDAPGPPAPGVDVEAAFREAPRAERKAAIEEPGPVRALIQSGRPPRAWVIAFALMGVVLAGASWWLLSGPSSTVPQKAAAPATAPAAAPAAAPGLAPGSTPEEPASKAGPALTIAAERWLDAYYRKDSASLASVATRDMKISDERGIEDRLPAGLVSVRRQLDRVAFQFVGDSAILTARMIEEATVGGRPRQRVAWVSQMWIRETGQWRLMDVHMLSDAKLKPPKER